MTTKVSSPISDFVMALAVIIIPTELEDAPRFALKYRDVPAGKKAVFVSSIVVCIAVDDDVDTVADCEMSVVKFKPSSVE